MKSKIFRSVLIIGQIFGLLPVSLRNNADEMRFKYLSFKTFYAFLLQLLCFSEFAALSCILFDNGFDFKAFGNVLFYSTGLFTSFYLIFNANKWINLIVLWEKHEAIFCKPPYSHVTETIMFARKVKCLCGFLIGFLISEFHLIRGTKLLLIMMFP
jgi:hypothetical protein